MKNLLMSTAFLVLVAMFVICPNIIYDCIMWVVAMILMVWIHFNGGWKVGW